MIVDEIFAGESENIEFKEDIPPKSEKYMKTIVAFANGAGGKLIFGVQDNDLEIVGFDRNEVFQKMDAVTNAIYDSCEPKIKPNIAIQEINEKSVIVVEISSGMQKPYYIKNLGMMEGTFIRVSGTTRKAQASTIQELILDGTNRSFDQLESSLSITDKEVDIFCQNMYQYALKLCNTEEARQTFPKVSKNQLLSWKLISEQGGKIIPSNGYLLLNGNQDAFPEATIQCAVFKGTVRDIFITKKEFAGALYQQIDDAYHFVLQHINLGCRIEGIARQDTYELPVKTIREMIANAVCHRSFLTPGKIQVALFDDREAWGSGIPRMFHEAAAYGLPEPELVDLGSDFRVNLYRAGTKVGTSGTKVGTNGTKVGTKTKTDTEIVLNTIRSDTKIRQKDIHEKTGIPLRTIKRIMASLQQEGKLERKGTNRSGEWIVKS